MNVKETYEWWCHEAENIFSSAFFSEYFGGNLFQPGYQRNYFFESSEKGDAVWITPNHSKGKIYKVIEVEEFKKFSTQPIVPMLTNFSGSAPINFNWIEDGEKRKIQDGLVRNAMTVAQQANKAFCDVLIKSLKKGNSINIKGNHLENLIVESIDEMSSRGFKVDKILIPENLKGKIIHLMKIAPANDVKISSYIGKTQFRQDIFSTSNLEDTILFFDSSETLALQTEPKFYRDDKEALTNNKLHVHINLELNPIVKNTQAVFAIEGIQSSLMQKRNIRPVNKERAEKFIDDSWITDTFYQQLIDEINDLYREGLAVSLAILVRKLMENLIIDILRKKYQTKEIDLYYRPNQRRFQDFSKLIENLDLKKGDLQHITPKLDKGFIDLLNKHRETGNASAHSIEVNLDIEQIENDKKEINDIMNLLLKILNNIP